MLFLALTAANINIFFRFVKFCEVITADPLVRRKFLNKCFYTQGLFDILNSSETHSELG